MKICFIAELDCFHRWQDGLRAAMNLLADEHEVCYHLDGVLGSHTPDLLMAWGGSFAPTTQTAREYGGQSLLFFAGGGIEPKYFEGIDVVCFENEIHTIEARLKGIKCLTAFGTDIDTFRSDTKQPKVWDVIYPAAFGLWKRKDLFAKSVKGLRALTLGNIQEHEMECYNVCRNGEINYCADIPQDRLSYFYNMSHVACILPVAEIGGQRTILEAYACNMPVVIPSDAPLVGEYGKFATIVPPDPKKINQAIRENIGKKNLDAYNWLTHNCNQFEYAKKIKQAIEML